MVKMLMLREELDDWHQRRADKHGRLYLPTRRLGWAQDLYEAKSVVTGVLCTLEKRFCEEAPDGEEAA